MSGFWNEREQVERFAARAPDERLQELLREFTDPSVIRVLDLGCAAGRNTVLLAARGFDVWAADASKAMVDRTRARLAEILGEAEARRRVRLGRMDRLDRKETASFDLVVALGVYHCAASRREWDRSLAESARVLKTGGRCLVSVFTPRTDLTGEGVRPVPGQEHLFEGFPGGPSFLVDAATLDDEMVRHGLLALVPTQTVTRPTDRGQRVSANGLYQKRSPTAWQRAASRGRGSR